MQAAYYLPETRTPKALLPTPALVVDLDAMEENIERMALFFRDKPAKLRPHFKTHKSPLLAHKQIRAGAIGMTCAKLGEAEVLVEAGIGNVLIANQIVDPLKIARLAQLAGQTTLIVAVDQADNLHQISAAAQKAGTLVGVVIEVDVGLHRCGVQPGPAAVTLAQLAGRLPGIHFAGVLGYEGHTVLLADTEQRSRESREAMQVLVSTADLIRQAGLPVEIVSGGGTGTYDLTGAFPGITEVEAGSYLFMDTQYSRLDLPFRCALSLLATVVSTPAPGRAVIDAGMKVLSTDNGLPEVVSPAGVKLAALNEEHGRLEIDPGLVSLRVGDRVELIPSHVCTTVNLHDRYYAVRDDRLEEIWPITGRGKSQ
jgi:D-serine deaminase-like pyridoxal phosphate-dependent protein